MLLTTQEIIEDIAQRNHLSPQEVRQLNDLILSSKETEIHIGDSIIIPDIHKVAENVLDIEKRIYLLNLEPLRQTHTKNLQAMLQCLRSLGLSSITDDFLARLASLDPRYTPAFVYGDNWISLKDFFRAARILEHLAGSRNPRAFQTYAQYGMLKDSITRCIELEDGFTPRAGLSKCVDRLLIWLASTRDLVGLGHIKTRLANYDALCQHVSTEQDPQNGHFISHCCHKYFENFRDDMDWLHEWWLIGCFAGIPALKERHFAEPTPLYYLDDLVKVLQRDYAYLSLNVARSPEHNGAILVNGRPVSHPVVLGKTQVDCHGSFIVRHFSSGFPKRRGLFDPHPIEISTFNESELAELLATGECIKVDLCTETMYDEENQVVIREGEIWGAPYSYVILEYSGQRDRDYDLSVDPHTSKGHGAKKLWRMRSIEDANLRANLRLRFVELQRATESEKFHRARAEKERDESTQKSAIFQSYTRRSLVSRVDSGEDPRQDPPELASMAVLFADIRDFTALSEKMSAEDVVRFLNSYFDQMNEPVLRWNGEIDKLMGDCIMAGFPCNADEGGCIRNAVRAAIDMRRQLQQYNRERWEYFEEHIHRRMPDMPFMPVNNGIGVTYGSVVTGNIGSEHKKDYTLVGDVVNAASRLEGLTKWYRVGILVSEDAHRELGDGFSTRYVDLVRVKGRSKELRVYEVFDHEPEPIRNMKLELRPQLNHAFDLYAEAQFEEALRVYEQVRAEVGPHHLHPHDCADPILDFLMERCRMFKRQKDVGLLDLAKWQGIYEFKEK